MKVDSSDSVRHSLDAGSFGKTVIAGLLTAILLFSMAPSLVVPAHAATIPGACNCVIFRLDDIQDFWLDTVQVAVMDKFINTNEKLSVGAIMNFVGSDASVVNEVRQGAQRGTFEIASHAWNHVDHSQLSLQEQHDTLQLANQKMVTLWGTSPLTFIAPYNAYNNDTLTALSQLNMKIISAEFDQELLWAFDPDQPDSPNNMIYKAIPNSNIKDPQGIYHLPETIGFYNYETPEGAKNPVSTILAKIDDTISSYGYAVVTLHPQDFAVKDAKKTPLNQLNPAELTDLETILTSIHDKGYTTKTFNEVLGISPPPVTDNVPPVVTPPPDVAVVSPEFPATNVTLGSPAVADNVDPSPTVTNDAPPAGFPQGTTTVTWTATDDAGNVGHATQYVTVRASQDTVKPIITITEPLANQTITGPTTGVNVVVKGNASDSQTGIKIVQVKPSNLVAYKTATPQAAGDWTTWSYTLTLTASGDYEITARADDFWGNSQWYVTPIKVALGAVADTKPPQITSVPPDVVKEATGVLTPVSPSELGTITAIDDTDTAVDIRNDAPGQAEGSGFPIGTTIVNWTATDDAKNSATATQKVTILPLAPIHATPEPGAYNGPQNVVLTSSQTAGVWTIHYTVDGSTPTANSTTYSTGSTIPISQSTSLKAVLVDAAGKADATVTTLSYTIDTTAPTVTASPAAGAYNSAQSITLTPSETENTKIYYTTDGTNPTASSTHYVAPILIESSTTLKFVAEDAVGNLGPVSEAIYVINIVSSGGGGGGGGGGSSGGSIGVGGEIITYPDSHFVTNPLDKIKFVSFGVVSPQNSNVVLTSATPGQQVSISATFKNYQNSPQSYVYITQVEKDGMTVSIDWVTGAVNTGQTETATRSWTAGPDAGEYVVKVFVWDSLGGSPFALSEVGTSHITVQEAMAKQA